MSRGRQRARSTNGFTLVELVVVVMVLGILAGIAVPATVGVFSNAAEQTVVTQVQQIFTAAELYHAQHGDWPANAGRKQLPAELAGVLPETLFTEPTPLGSFYDWNGPGTTIPTYGVTIQGVPPAQMLSIDQMADDGDLGSGWVRRNAYNLNFVIAEK